MLDTLDTWTEDSAVDPEKRQSEEDKSLLDEVIRQSLHRELERRRELPPHAQLGVPLHADGEKVRAAYQRLRTRYLPESYARHGDEARRLAAEIGTLLCEAHDELQEPRIGPVVAPRAPERRSDQTLRAVETLRRAIDRRHVEAIAHRDAGRLPEALRAFESVLALDRHHAEALEQIRALRAQLDPPRRPGVLARLVARIRPPK